MLLRRYPDAALGASVDVWRKLLIFIGSLGPVGHLPASGTAAVVLVGVPLFAAMHAWPGWLFTVTTLALTGVAVRLHEVGDRLLGQKDSPILVWDEVVGFLFAVALIPFTWQLALAAVLIERTLDILKVPPADWIEDHLPGGWGVVGDDVIAGLYTNAALHVIANLMPKIVGI